MIQIIPNVSSSSPLRDKMHLELLDPLLSFHLRTILVVCEICQLLKSSLEFEKKGIIVSTTVESNSKLSTTTMKNSRFDEELSNSDVSLSWRIDAIATLFSDSISAFEKLFKNF